VITMNNGMCYYSAMVTNRICNIINDNEWIKSFEKCNKSKKFFLDFIFLTIPVIFLVYTKY
jgi:hypothetical protein